MSVTPDGRRMLRLEVRNAAVPIEKKPPWIKTRLRTGPEYTELKNLVKREGLHTVCEEAGCPNIFECWEDREATFLIGGEQCTRRCDFCQIDTGKPAPLDRDEPRRVAESVQAMGLRYATVTGVARDDLDDEGAWLYAETIRQIKALNPSTGVEILVPDFSARPELLQQIFDAAPEVFAHNLETVPRLSRQVRVQARYDRSYRVLEHARKMGAIVKTGLMLGLGEELDEVRDVLRELGGLGVHIVTMGQYLRPSKNHLALVRYVTPAEFAQLKDEALAFGITHVESGPLVRSSYHADGQADLVAAIVAKNRAAVGQ
jgi:lipoic acid synthetase